MSEIALARFRGFLLRGHGRMARAWGEVRRLTVFEVAWNKNRIIRCGRLVGSLLVAFLLSFAGWASESGAPGESTTRRVVYRVGPGWTLVHFPFGSPASFSSGPRATPVEGVEQVGLTEARWLHALEEAKLRWFLVEGSETATEWTPLAVPEWDEGHFYWVWSAEAVRFALEGPWPSRSVFSQAAVGTKWWFFAVSASEQRAGEPADRLLRWDSDAQIYVSFSPDAPLVPGRGYLASFDGVSSLALGAEVGWVDETVSDLPSESSGSPSLNDFGSADLGDFGSADSGDFSSADSGDFSSADSGSFGSADSGDFGSADSGVGALENSGTLVAGYASGNYGRALEARGRHMRFSEGGDGQTMYYQVEYEPVGLDGEGSGVGPPEAEPGWIQAASEDARYLAGFERVWAYTQGVALAQVSRPWSQKGDEAQGLARFLCAHAQWNGDRSKILGWPFSWNTLDPWKDARLVTGATAWVVHGLGLFLSSEASFALESSGEREDLRACYLAALSGLQDHRRNVYLQDGRLVSLVTAGWTVTGLAHADDPGALRGPDGEAVVDDARERWSYYSVLDGIGYDVFAPFELMVCRHGGCGSPDSGNRAWVSKTIEREEVWSAMRVPVRARNVVTEHNIDVLSVLNHAIDHADELGLPASGALSPGALGLWRNSLRDGIFHGLWNDEGRVVTGGQLHPEGPDGFSLEKSPHTAIDNCSWLSMAVDYSDFEIERSFGRTLYRDRLRACLEYTVRHFVKGLDFDQGACDSAQQTCLPPRIYLGAHYFQNAFHDPYISPSDRQASSYHLEATMGLILGLLDFAEAYPEHPSSARLRTVAHLLWAGAQSFVYDYGFPYSSQRIHNLSAQLSSSTALLWFIDVYEHLHKTDRPAEPLLRTQALGFDSPTPAPSVENLQLAVRHAVDGILTGKFAEAGVSEDAIAEFGAGLLLAPPRLIARHGNRVVRWFDEVARLPREWALGAMVGVNSALYLSTAQVDLGLETIFVSADVPSEALWERVGVVPSEAVVTQPAGSHMRSEAEIRSQLAIYPEGPVLNRPLANPPIPFEDHAIYLIQITWLGLELPFGRFGVLTPGSDALWPVFRLKSERPRSDILDEFVHNHKFFKEIAPYAESLPEGQRAAFLYLVELVIRGDFNRLDLVALGRGEGLEAGASKGSRTGSTKKKPHAPFFVTEGPGPKVSVVGGRDGLESAVVVQVPKVKQRRRPASGVKLTKEDQQLVRRLMSQRGHSTYPWGRGELMWASWLRLYHPEELLSTDLRPEGVHYQSFHSAMSSLVESELVSTRGKPPFTSYLIDVAQLHQIFDNEVQRFWGEASGLEEALGDPVTSVAEHNVLKERLQTAWWPLARVLDSPVVQAHAYVLQRYGALSVRELAKILEFPRGSGSTLERMVEVGLVVREQRPVESVYHLNDWVLFQYHLDLHRFLYKRTHSSLSRTSKNPRDRVVLPNPKVAVESDSAQSLHVPPAVPQLTQVEPPTAGVGLSTKRGEQIDKILEQGQLWNTQTRRRVVAHLYQVDRATRAQMDKEIKGDSSALSRALEDLVSSGWLSTESEDEKTTYYVLDVARVHALHRTEVDYFWSGAADIETALSSEAPSFIEQIELAERLNEHWEPLISVLGVKRFRVFVSLLIEYTSLSYVEFKTVFPISRDSFRQMIERLLRAKIVERTGRPGSYRYHLRSELLFQYHYEWRRFLSKM